MAKFRLEAGMELETVTPREMHDYMDGREQARADRLRGIKFRRLPPMNGAVTAAAAIAIGGDNPVSPPFNEAGQTGPSSGHLWVIRLLSVNGLAGSDVLNMQILGAADPDFSWWQFNGTNFAYGWGKNEIWLLGGEYLQFSGSGITAPANTRIRIRGMIQQVPAELAAELV